MMLRGLRREGMLIADELSHESSRDTGRHYAFDYFISYDTDAISRRLQALLAFDAADTLRFSSAITMR